MAEKKDRGRFTIKFNENDPMHDAVIELLEKQGPRQKAQYIVNAVLSYAKVQQTQQTPETPPAQAVDREMIESIVREILENLELEKEKPSGSGKSGSGGSDIPVGETEDEKTFHLISETMSAFRNL